MKDLLATARPALWLLVLFTVLTGVAYPALLTGVAQALFPHQAAGSLIRAGGTVVGSELIGQAFTDPAYFWSRPSALGTFAYDARNSTGSNLGPTNPALLDAVRTRVDALRAADPGNTAPVPVDLVTASGSGLDPDISPAAAHYQAPRVARRRGLSIAAVRAVIDRLIEARTLGFLGEPRVNVLALNRALDGLARPAGAAR